nr:hypothetical protein [Pseudoalteromonas sp. HM-SA03]
MWVSETLRGQNIGSQILKNREAAVKQRGGHEMLTRYLKF